MKRFLRKNFLGIAQERRPNAIAGGFNNGRDFFQNQQDDRNSGEPLLSVEDIDIGNRLKRKYFACNILTLRLSGLTQESKRL